MTVTDTDCDQRETSAEILTAAGFRPVFARGGE